MAASQKPAPNRSSLLCVDVGLHDAGQIALRIRIVSEEPAPGIGVLDATAFPWCLLIFTRNPSTEKTMELVGYSWKGRKAELSHAGPLHYSQTLKPDAKKRATLQAARSLGV
jgi:hypothetical protein